MSLQQVSTTVLHRNVDRIFSEEQVQEWLDFRDCMEDGVLRQVPEDVYIMHMRALYLQMLSAVATKARGGIRALLDGRGMEGLEQSMKLSRYIEQQSGYSEGLGAAKRIYNQAFGSSSTDANIQMIKEFNALVANGQLSDKVTSAVFDLLMGVWFNYEKQLTGKGNDIETMSEAVSDSASPEISKNTSDTGGSRQIERISNALHEMKIKGLFPQADFMDVLKMAPEMVRTFLCEKMLNYNLKNYSGSRDVSLMHLISAVAHSLTDSEEATPLAYAGMFKDDVGKVIKQLRTDQEICELVTQTAIIAAMCKVSEGEPVESAIQSILDLQQKDLLTAFDTVPDPDSYMTLVGEFSEKYLPESKGAHRSGSCAGASSSAAGNGCLIPLLLLIAPGLALGWLM